MATADEAERYRAALESFEAGSLEAAEAGFQAFLEAFPHSDLADNALYQLGMIFSMTDRKPQALEAFRACVKAYAGSDAAPLAQEQAEILVDEIELDRSTEARSLFHRARNLAGRGEFEAAKELFLRCIEDHPESFFTDNVYLSLSMIYSLEGHFREARRMLELILEHYPDSDAAAAVPAALKQLERDERYA